LPEANWGEAPNITNRIEKYRQLCCKEKLESEGISIIKQRTRLKAEYIKPRSDLMACESLGRRIAEE